MGLTIHYSLRTKLTGMKEIRNLVSLLHDRALDLPFQTVEEIVEFRGQEVNSDNDDPDRWLKIQAGQHLEVDGVCHSVEPSHIIAFTTIPGDGCEPANFGLCTYPSTINVHQRQLSTHLTGWQWRSFCKTQYASDPDCGGVENFVRCHLCVVHLLDFAQKTGLIDVEVSDEGDYWTNRDVKELAHQVGEWNEMIAAVAGQFKDAAAKAGVTVEAPITKRADFEQLEAKGQKNVPKKLF